MPSEVYSILVKAGYKGTEQEMFRTFAHNSVSSLSISNWNYAYAILSATGAAGMANSNRTSVTITP